MNERRTIVLASTMAVVAEVQAAIGDSYPVASWSAPLPPRPFAKVPIRTTSGAREEVSG